MAVSDYNCSRKKSHHGQRTSLKTGARRAPVTKTPFETSGNSPTVDLFFENHGSIFLIRPVSPSGQNFLDEKVGDSETLTFGRAVVCEPRYVEAVYRGALAEGLVCE
jgi:hypothetical protein